MTWDELFDNLGDFEQHHLLVQVAERRPDGPHAPVVTVIGKLASSPHGLPEQRGRDALALSVRTETGDICGAIMLREAEFEDAERRDEHLLVVSYAGLDVSFALREAHR